MLRTRLTERLKLAHPVISAPMGFAAGGKLAAAVSAAGGLGLIGGGYGNEQWLRQQLAVAGNQSIGCGFITWALHRQPHLLDLALEHAPRAMFLSFGDPQPFAGRIAKAGVLLICQIQTLADARRAIDVGADIVVAQGAEAGGHGDKRATLTLVPEVADLLSARAPDTLLCAAGGIADGRGKRLVAETEIKLYAEAAARGEVRQSPVAIIGEAVGLIRDVAPARKILDDLISEAEEVFEQRAPAWLSKACQTARAGGGQLGL